MNYFCCDELRREAVINHTGLNGIDFLEVVDRDATLATERQRVLRIAFLKKPAPAGLEADNVLITGGERITNVRADDVRYDGDILVVHVNTPGDYSTYTLRLVKAEGSGDPPDGLDPVLSAIDFSFKVECGSDFDCLARHICSSKQYPRPEINYLAKDYASFKQLMLDRMVLLMPQWKERNAADLGIALVELLAYVGDRLSYQQDAVATEAYLNTARQRISVRRHARLVDYFVHEGCNSRVWVQVQVTGNVTLPKGTPLLTRLEGQSTRFSVNSPSLQQAMGQQPEVFETMHTAPFFPSHNEIAFYTWGDERCCLKKGATQATLKDDTDANKRLLLCPGDVLIFEERLGPKTGLETDADLRHRHAVRLTRVTPEAKQSISGGIVSRTAKPPVTDPLTGQAVVKIEWHDEDALPFSLWISSETDKEHGQRYITNVSVARGNVVLADHGTTLPDSDLGTVPKPTLFREPSCKGDPCSEQERFSLPPRFRPRLKERPVTHAVPYPYREENFPASACAAMLFSPGDALAAVTRMDCEQEGRVLSWAVKRDLLNSTGDAKECVLEVEADGAAYLRFGDNEHGLRPSAGAHFNVTYRMGNGTRGNVGAEAIRHIVSNDQGIEKVRNPLPAAGGVDPESIEEVRQKAPSAFRIQERAVTPEDYAAVAERHPEVQRAAATLRWTGSWHTVFVTIDRVAGRPVDDVFKKKMRDHIERYRMAAQDVEIDAPLFVSLEIEMLVCVKPDYFRGEVRAALELVFSNRILPDGRRGVFHPDNFSFGQTVYLSPLYAAAQAVAGVASVRITKFQRQGRDSDEALHAGKLVLERLEIPRLDNDPNFREHGLFTMSFLGGK
jgi:hypothetical protein